MSTLIVIAVGCTVGTLWFWLRPKCVCGEYIVHRDCPKHGEKS